MTQLAKSVFIGSLVAHLQATDDDRGGHRLAAHGLVYFCWLGRVDGVTGSRVTGEEKIRILCRGIKGVM